MEKVYNLDFGNIICYDFYMVAILNEGIEFKKEENDQLLKISRDHFKNKEYGFISYRLNSYSVDPLVYKTSSQEANMKAVAIVCSDEIKRLSYSIEKLFYSKDLEHFHELQNAIEWIKTKLESYSVSEAS